MIMEKKSILEYETVELDTKENELVIIDQTKLPGNIEIIRLKTAEEIWNAIYLLKVRGAPAIGVAAAMGLYVLAGSIKTDSYVMFYEKFEEYKDYLNSARPTAVNLSWALSRMDRLVRSMKDSAIPDILKALEKEAQNIKKEDIAVCRAIGEYGLSLVKRGDGRLTVMRDSLQPANMELPRHRYIWGMSADTDLKYLPMRPDRSYRELVSRLLNCRAQVLM